ncbi:hypothetical protein MPER_11112, partial [Moniliophthora perniciosa FA553]
MPSVKRIRSSEDFHGSKRKCVPQEVIEGCHQPSDALSTLKFEKDGQHTRSSDFVFARIGTRWSKLKTLVIFGDSYSALHGDTGEETWADHITSLQDCEEVLVRNYARRGSTAREDVTPQVARFLADYPADSSLRDDATEALYVIYFGINDCGCTDEDELEPIIETLFDAVHVLFTKAGARNFLFIDVPPLDRTPAGKRN